MALISYTQRYIEKIETQFVGSCNCECQQHWTFYVKRLMCILYSRLMILDINGFKCLCVVTHINSSHKNTAEMNDVPTIYFSIINNFSCKLVNTVDIT